MGTNSRDDGNQSKKQDRRQRIIVVTDSNGKKLNAQQLKPGAEVGMKERFRLKQAIDQTPKVSNPQEIDDVVFQIGLNDFQDCLNQEEIIDKYFGMQMKYKKLFPNARQHVTAIPPLTNEHVAMNKGLQKLAQDLECNFISAKPFQDHSTGKLRANLMKSDMYHYNDIGVRHLAKEIKKSLFSTANRKSEVLSQLMDMRAKNQQH